MKWICKTCNTEKTEIWENGCPDVPVCSASPLVPYCSRCNVEMKMGEAIPDNNPRGAWGIFHWPLFNWKTIKLVPCLKCPSCGYSEEI